MNKILEKYYDKLQPIYTLEKLNNPYLKLLVHDHGFFYDSYDWNSPICETICMKNTNDDNKLFDIAINPDDGELILEVGSEYGYLYNDNKLRSYIKSLKAIETDKVRLSVHFGSCLLIYCYNLNDIFNNIIDILFEFQSIE